MTRSSQIVAPTIPPYGTFKLERRSKPDDLLFTILKYVVSYVQYWFYPLNRDQFIKFSLLTLWLYLPFQLCAGIPSGYYDTANGLSGTTLQSALHEIINGHNKFSYTSVSTDVWDLLKITDEDPDNSSNVILLYTGRSQA